MVEPQRTHRMLLTVIEGILSENCVYAQTLEKLEGMLFITIPAVKHDGGNIMLWRYFSLVEAGGLVRVDGMMNTAKYRAILFLKGADWSG